MEIDTVEIEPFVGISDVKLQINDSDFIFYKNGTEIGKISFSDDKIKFGGNVEESAKILFECFGSYLKINQSDEIKSKPKTESKKDKNWVNIFEENYGNRRSK